jgi:hypothetical protein
LPTPSRCLKFLFRLALLRSIHLREESFVEVNQSLLLISSNFRLVMGFLLPWYMSVLLSSTISVWNIYPSLPPEKQESKEVFGSIVHTES